MTAYNDPLPNARWRRRFFVLLLLIVVPLVVVGLYLFQRFGGDTPVDYASNEEQFKYGSTGGEHEMGFPYWIWRALPRCAPNIFPVPDTNRWG
jgi:hypothetical protein